MREYRVRVAVLFDHFGPYHRARLRAASQICQLLAIQVRRRSLDYAWAPAPASESFCCYTLEEAARGSSQRELVRSLADCLTRFRPNCVFIPGWSSRCSLAALCWCVQSRVPAVMMSESTQTDRPRSRWRERLKSLLVSACAAGLVGGAPQAEYLAGLGLPLDRIFLGYDVVDNDYFCRGAREIRDHSQEFRRRRALPEHYFLASARFVPEKNLPWLIRAYAVYRAANSEFPSFDCGRARAGPWPLVVLGDGDGRPQLERQVAELGLQRWVLLSGFKQYAELPVYYALADVFVHASTVEPWGLVVNEAMASGLPVLVSNRCGCARDLVRGGVNGFTFNPADTQSIASLLVKLSSSQSSLERLGRASSEAIAAWGPDRFRQGFQRATVRAIEHGPARRRLVQRLLLESLVGR